MTDPAGDLEADGIPNLLEYALRTDPIVPDAARLPVVAIEGGDLTLTYSKVTTATDVQYSVEKSSDLASWGPANPTNEIIATEGVVQTIKAKVPMDGSSPLFLRLRITRPNEPRHIRPRR